MIWHQSLLSKIHFSDRDLPWVLVTDADRLGELKAILNVDGHGG
jgi:hypothetical protein